MMRRPLLCLVFLGAFACSAPFAEEEHSGGPPAGAVRFVINVNYPSGSTADPDGFIASGPGFDITAGVFGGEIFSPGLPGGSQAVVRVGSVGEWCTLSPTQRSITIQAGDTIDAVFQINCGTLYRATRIIYRQDGSVTDTAALSVTVQATYQMYPDDTLRLMQPVGRNFIGAATHPGCVRLQSELPYLDVPYYPADTLNYTITMTCA